jgi:hypothetical protein
VDHPGGDFVTERIRHLEIVIDNQRRINKSYKDKKEGEKQIVRERQVAMVYDVADTSLVTNWGGNIDTIDKYYDCKQSAMQLTYTGYLETLRSGYRDATQTAQELAVADHISSGEIGKDGSNLDILTSTAYLTQGTPLLHEFDPPTEDYEPPEWKTKMSEEHEQHNLDLDDVVGGDCSFMNEDHQTIMVQQQANVIPAFHTTMIPLRAGGESISRLNDKSTFSIVYDEDFRTKLENLKTAAANAEISKHGMSGLFANDGDNYIEDNNGGRRHFYISGELDNASRDSLLNTHNEQAKKAREMKRVLVHTRGHTTIPDFMHSEEDPEQFKPWGKWDDPSYKTDIRVRQIRRSQNVGMSLLKILRWLGTSMTQEELEEMNQYIEMSREGNIIGADGEFKMERDQIDAMGYTLKDLFDIKKMLAETDSHDSMKLGEYRSHFAEFYSMSYHDYSMLSEGGGTATDEDTPDYKQQMLDLVVVSIRIDIIKHLQHIGINRQSIWDPSSTVTNVVIQPQHKAFLLVVKDVLNALMKNAGSDIIDPDRSEIDWLYHERFVEYAVKKNVVTVKSVREESGLSINDPYAGSLEKDLTEFVPTLEGADDDFDPFGEDAGPEDVPRGEELNEAEYEELDGFGNTGEGEAEWDPMQDDMLN